MNEPEMTSLLKQQIVKLEPTGFDLAMDKQFLYVGEWLLAFEGVYVANQKYPGVLDPDDIQALTNYFGVDMSELDL